MKVTEVSRSNQQVSDEQEAPIRIASPFKDHQEIGKLGETTLSTFLHKSENQRTIQTKVT